MLLVVVSGRDAGGIDATQAEGPGALEPVNPRLPAASAEPPTSGPHAQRNVMREGRLDTDALLTALEQGNVVVAYPGPGEPPAGLRRLQETVSGPFDPELAAAGQMVVITRWPGLSGVQALAYRRRLRARGPGDPALRAFAEAWLGQGRGNTG